MDGTQLFWATGIDNTKLRLNAQEGLQIFRALAKDVNKELKSIERQYKNLQTVAKVKFANPVDATMIKSIENQLRSLEKVVNKQIDAIAKMSQTYDGAMTKIQKASAKLGQNVDPLNQTVVNVKKRVKEAGDQLNFLEKRFKTAFATLVAYGSFSGIKDFVQSMITATGQFDQLRVAIDSFVGDAEKGKIIFQELTSLAVKSPFQLMDITDSAKQLLAYGVAAKDVTESVKRLSDVSAGSGQSIKDIAYLYGTSLTQGRLYARDLFQFANRGIPIYKELAKVMGISTKQLSDQVKAGKVGFEELKQAIENMTSAGGLYFGLSDKLAETTYGKLSNLKDKWQIALDEMGQASGGIVNLSIEGISKLIEHWEDAFKALQSVILGYGSYRAALVLVNVAQMTQVQVLRNVAKAHAALNAVMYANPYTLAAVALGGFVAVMWSMFDATTASERALKLFNQQQKDTNDMAERQKRAIQDNIAIIKNETSGQIERKMALSELQRILPDVYKGLTIEQIQNSKLNNEISRGNDLIDLNKIKKIKAAKEVAENRKKELQAEIDAEKLRKPTSGEISGFGFLSGGKLGQLQEDLKAQDILIEKYDKSIKAYSEMQNVVSDVQEETEEEDEKAKEAAERRRERELRKREAFAKTIIDIEASTEASRQLIVRESYERSANLIKLNTSKRLSDLEKERINLIAKARLVGVNVSEAGVVTGTGDDANQVRVALENITEQRKNILEKDSAERIELERKTQEAIDKINYDAFKSFDSDLQKQLTSIEEKYRKLRLDIERDAKTSQIEPMKMVLGLAESQEVEKAYSDRRRTVLEYEYDTRMKVNQLREESAAFGRSKAMEEIDIEADKNQKLLEENQRYYKLLQSNIASISANDRLDVAEKAKILESLRSQSSTYDEIIAKLKVTLGLLEFEGKKQKLSDMGKSFTDLGKTLNEIGDAIGSFDSDFASAIVEGAKFATEIGSAAMQIIQDVDKLSTMTINSVTGAAQAGAKAVSAVEKASVILAIISTAMQVMQKIKNMLNDSEYDEYQLKVAQTKLELQHKYNEALIRQSVIQNEMFGGSKYADALAYARAYYDALNKYADQYQNEEFTRIKKYYGWKSLFGTAMFGIFGSSKSDTETYTVNARRNMQIQTAAAKRGFLGIGGSHSKYENLEEWLKKQGYGNLFDEKGSLNLTLAETVVGMENLTDETKKFLQQLIDSTKLINEMEKGLEDYINDTFGSLGDSMTSAIVDAFKNGTDAAEQFKTDITAILEDVGAQMIRSLFLQDAIQSYSDRLKAIYKKQRIGTDEQNAAEISREVAQATSEYFGTLTEMQKQSTSWLEEYKKMASQFGFDLYNPEEDGVGKSSGATSNAIKSITQDQADFLSAQFSAMRINMSDIKIDVSKILLNLSNNQLQMANQTNLLEIAFQDVHEIAVNTRELFDIKKGITDIIRDGLRVR